MKKLTSKKSHLKQNTKIAIAATMLAVPMLYSPTTIIAQEKKSTERIVDATFKFANLFLKLSGPDGEFSIVGFNNNHTIYKNNKGECFWVDPNNGDLKFLPKNSKFVKVFDKTVSKVTLLGVDAKGNVIQKNSKGEKFYLNSTTGDMVFVK